MEDSWVKLHRKFEEWEWYDDIPVKVLFIHLLIKANFKDAKWRGRLIKRGERLTSIPNLASETGLSEKQIRNALKKLEKTGDVGRQTTNQFSIIELKNYNLYQEEGRQRADKGQTEGRRGATNKEEEEREEGKEGKDKKKHYVPLDEMKKKIDPGIRHEVLELFYTHGFKPSESVASGFNSWLTDCLNNNGYLTAKDIPRLKKKMFEFNTWAEGKRHKNLKSAFNNFLTPKKWEA